MRIDPMFPPVPPPPGEPQPLSPKVWLLIGVLCALMAGETYLFLHWQ